MKHLVGAGGSYIAPYAEIEDFEQLFQLSDSPTPLPSDVVLVSIDIEVSGGQRGRTGRRGTKPGTKGRIPHIREVGIASLDTRSLFSPPSGQKMLATGLSGNMEIGVTSPPMIKTRQYSTSHSSEDFQDCDVTDFRECAFATTCYVEEEDLVATITSCLESLNNNAISDENSASPRKIVLVGHSPERDLDILQQLGVEFGCTASVVVVLDTHYLSKQVLGPSSPLVIKGQCAALSKYALSDVLTELGCAYDWNDLHNAGNDATYTLHALVKLAIRWAEGKELIPEQSVQVERLRKIAEAESQAPRWKPFRRALGAYTVDLKGETAAGPVRLGSGLKSLVDSMKSSPTTRGP